MVTSYFKFPAGTAGIGDFLTHVNYRLIEITINFVNVLILN